MANDKSPNKSGAQSNDDFSEVSSWIGQIDTAVDQIFANNVGDVPKKCKRFLLSINHYKAEAYSAARIGGVGSDEFIAAIESLRERAADLVLAARVEAPRSALYDRCFVLNKIVQSKFKDLTDEPAEMSEDKNVREKNAEIKRLTAAVELLKLQLSERQQENNKFRKSIESAQERVQQIEGQISSHEQRVNDALASSSAAADLILEGLYEKQNRINELAGIVSADAISGSYGVSAETEKRFADSMRNGSVLLMLTVVSIIGYSLFETAKPHFEWETALFRLVFSLALSVPAAYLARESTKHRSQQYAYARVSLDLKAITPYLASLPPDEQHKLKVEMANRIFGSKDQSANPLESYPLNIQELLIAMISKFDGPKAGKSSGD